MKYSSKKFNIQYQADFSGPPVNEIRAWFAEPQDSNLQRIESFSISPKPKSSYKDSQGNKILYFEINNQKQASVKVNIKANLSKYKLDLAKAEFSTQRNIKSEEFLEQTPGVKDLARKLTASQDNMVNKIGSIFNFVVQNFKYEYPVKHRGVSHLDLKKLRGDCAEYSSLFVAMCRSLGIPSRNNTGFVIYPKQQNMVEHGWASIDTKKHGWLDFDTQYASIDEKSKYFGQRSDYRITFTDGFNIPLKPSIPNDFDIEYWNNEGLPMMRNSVQTLQPLVFAAKREVKFNSRIGLLR